MIRVFDSGDDSGTDRYTIMDGRQMWGCNAAPFHPQGIGMYCGEMPIENMRKTYRKSCWLGKRVSVSGLPAQVQKYIAQIRTN